MDCASSKADHTSSCRNEGKMASAEVRSCLTVDTRKGSSWGVLGSGSVATEEGNGKRGSNPVNEGRCRSNPGMVKSPDESPVVGACCELRQLGATGVIVCCFTAVRWMLVFLTWTKSRIMFVAVLYVPILKNAFQCLKSEYSIIHSEVSRWHTTWRSVCTTTSSSLSWRFCFCFDFSCPNIARGRYQGTRYSYTWKKTKEMIYEYSEYQCNFPRTIEQQVRATTQ